MFLKGSNNKFPLLKTQKTCSKLTLTEVVNAFQALEYKRAIRLEESSKKTFQARLKGKQRRKEAAWSEKKKGKKKLMAKKME